MFVNLLYDRVRGHDKVRLRVGVERKHLRFGLNHHDFLSKLHPVHWTRAAPVFERVSKMSC